MRSSHLGRVAFLIMCSTFADAQQPHAKDVLARAIHLADLYNWADAAPAFAEAERLFVDAKRFPQRSLRKTGVDSV